MSVYIIEFGPYYHDGSLDEVYRTTLSATKRNLRSLGYVYRKGLWENDTTQMWARVIRLEEARP